MSVTDHILFVVLVVAAPLFASFYMFPRLLRALAAGDTGLRLFTYNRIIVQGWFFFLLILGLWFWQGRPFGDLGLRFDWRWTFWAGLALAVAAGFVLSFIQQRLLASKEGRDRLLGQLKEISLFLPHTRDERNRFFLVGITAGVWEEALFRGFLLWYFSQWMGIWAALALSSVFFGIAHLYQGWKGFVRTGIVGLVFGSLYVLTGSLWVPMLLHAYVDINSGATVFEALRTRPATGEA